MKDIVVLALVASAALEQRTSYPPKGSPQQRAFFEEGQAAQRRFEQSLFVEAGFAPLEEYAAKRRVVIRALFESPYVMLPVSGVQIERGSNGAVALTIVGRAGQRKPAPLPASTWARLVGMQSNLFERRPYVPWDPPKADEKLPAAPPVCHGWIVRFAKTDGGAMESGSWAACGGDVQPGEPLAREIARVAVSTRPDCQFDPVSPFKSFAQCFSPVGQP